MGRVEVLSKCPMAVRRVIGVKTNLFASKSWIENLGVILLSNALKDVETIHELQIC